MCAFLCNALTVLAKNNDPMGQSNMWTTTENWINKQKNKRDNVVYWKTKRKIKNDLQCN